MTGTDALSQLRISKALPETDVTVFSCIDSTNTEAKRRIPACGGRAFLLAADEQTGGRGRQGKSFYSPSGTGIYMTLVIHPNVPIVNAVSVTTRASVAVCRAIRACTGLAPQIKWVNDLYLNGKKICGILVEAISDYAAGVTKSLVIGVGVNVTTEQFPELPQAGALNPTCTDRNALIAAIAQQLLQITEDLHDASYLNDYRAWSMVLGENVTYTLNGEQKDGRAVAIDECGGLEVEHRDGSRFTLQSGEITLRLRT